MRARVAAVSALSLLAMMTMVSVPRAEAAALTTVADYLSSLAENQTSGVTHELQFTPATALTGGAGNNSVTMAFPTGEEADWCQGTGALTTDTTTLRNGATALSGTLSAACDDTAGTITISGVDDLTAGTLYGVVVSGDVVDLGTPANNGPTNSHVITVTTNDGSSDIDSSKLAVDIIADDEVQVTGRVEPTLTFSITDNDDGDNIIGFGPMTSAAVRYADGTQVGAAAANAPVTLTLDTNADDGAVIEVKDTNPAAGTGLHSVGTGTTLVSTPAEGVVAGTEGFGIYALNAAATTGTLTIDAGFDNGGGDDVAISNSYQTLASTTAPIDGGSLDMEAVAAVSGVTPAGDYETTLTLLATGKF